MSNEKRWLLYPTNKLLAFIVGLLGLAFLPAAAQYAAFQAKPWSYLSSFCVVTNLIVLMVIFFAPLSVIGRDLRAWILRIAAVFLAFIALKLGAQLSDQIMRSNLLYAELGIM